MSTKRAEFIPAFRSSAIESGMSTLRLRELTHFDQWMQRAYFNNLSMVSRQARFMSAMPSIPEDILAELSSVDGSRHVGICAEAYVDGAYQMIAEARYVANKEQPNSCEFAISVVDVWQGNGLGKRLMANLERKACSMGIETMVGETLYDNKIMTNLARERGFEICRNRNDASALILSKSLSPSSNAIDGDKTWPQKISD